MRREGVEVERAHDERRGQLLHHVHEDEQPRGEEASPQQREVYARQRLARIAAERAGCVVHAGGHAGEARLDGVQRDRQEAHEVRVDERRDPARQEQPGADAERRLQGGGQPGVDARHRDEHPDGDDGPGRGVPEPDEPVEPGRPARARDARGVGEQQRDRDREGGGDRREHEAVPRQPEEARGEVRVPLPHREPQEHPGRHDEADRERRRADRRGGARPPPREPLPRARPATACRAVVARAAPGQLLDHEQEHDDAEQRARELRGRDPVPEGEPRAVDAGGERLHPEVRDRAVVGERLHEREPHAGDDGGPGERERHAEEGAPGPEPEGAPDLGHPARVLEERGPGEEVDVRVEHRDEHRDGAAQRPHVGEPVGPGLPPERHAQPRLHGARELQQVRVRVRHHVRGDGERQHERPLEEPASGEVVHRHEPRRRDADHRGPHPHPQAQPDGARDVLGQHRRGEVPPGLTGPRGEDRGADGQDRGRDEPADRGGAERERAWAAARQREAGACSGGGGGVGHVGPRPVHGGRGVVASCVSREPAEPP